MAEAGGDTARGDAGEAGPAGAGAAAAEDAIDAESTPTAAGAPDDDESPARESDAPPTPDEADLPARLEALLFVSDGAVEESALSRALGITRRRLDAALDALAEQLRDAERGVRLQRGPDGAQLVTAPEAAAYVEYFLGLEATRRLSTAALETLAIVAYRQPVTRGTIELIRGVSSDAAIATLRARGLVADGGRAEGPGRPVLWVTTQRFLQHFGLERPNDLPPLPADIELPAEEAGAQLGLPVADAGGAGEAGDAEGAAAPGAEVETDDDVEAMEAAPSPAEELEALSQTAGAILSRRPAAGEPPTEEDATDERDPGA